MIWFAHFVKSNQFVRQIYPNFELTESPGPSAFAKATADKQAPSPKPFIERVLSLGLAQAAEGIARKLYGWHLRRRSASWTSSDQVRLEAECLKLHTSSHRASTLTKFDAAMRDALLNTTGTKVLSGNTSAA